MPKGIKLNDLLAIFMENNRYLHIRIYDDMGNNYSGLVCDEYTPELLNQRVAKAYITQNIHKRFTDTVDINSTLNITLEPQSQNK